MAAMKGNVQKRVVTCDLTALTGWCARGVESHTRPCLPSATTTTDGRHKPQSLGAWNQFRWNNALLSLFSTLVWCPFVYGTANEFGPDGRQDKRSFLVVSNHQPNKPTIVQSNFCPTTREGTFPPNSKNNAPTVCIYQLRLIALFVSKLSIIRWLKSLGFDCFRLPVLFPPLQLLVLY